MPLHTHTHTHTHNRQQQTATDPPRTCSHLNHVISPHHTHFHQKFVPFALKRGRGKSEEGPALRGRHHHHYDHDWHTTTITTTLTSRTPQGTCPAPAHGQAIEQGLQKLPRPKGKEKVRAECISTERVCTGHFGYPWWQLNTHKINKILT
jgi:hypothetical protein